MENDEMTNPLDEMSDDELLAQQLAEMEAEAAAAAEREQAAAAAPQGPAAPAPASAAAPAAPPAAPSGGAVAAEFPHVEARGNTPGALLGLPDLSRAMDLELKAYLELGTTRLTVADLLKLGRGAVVMLDQMVGEPCRLLVQGKEFARGEVVVLDGYYGIRITHLAETGASRS